MLTDRQKLILKAIIEEYVATSQPVGSKSLTEKPYLDFSSATLRYDMARLEDLGFLEKTHTSSGRVPSEKGYRYYVEHLVTRDYDVLDAFPQIDAIFSRRELAKESAIKEAINLLSELTQYTTLALGPNVDRTRIKRLDFVPLSASEAVLLIVTNHGHVQNQIIRIPDGMEIEDVRRVISMLDDVLRDRLIYEAKDILSREFASIKIRELMDYQEQLIHSFINAFTQFTQDNIYMSGMTHVFHQPEFNDLDKIKNFMDAMAKKDVLRVISDEQTGLTIKIGKDNKIVPMEHCTVISIPYAITDDEYGTIAVIGPTRMEYRRVIPLLEYIAQSMSRLYKK